MIEGMYGIVESLERSDRLRDTLIAQERGDDYEERS